MEKNIKEKEIITQLRSNRKTWTELEENVKMSTKTLNKTLMKLMDEGKVIKYGTVEFGKIVNYYDLVKKKESAIVNKVPAMFEKKMHFSGLPMIKKELDLEQMLTKGLYGDFRQLMRFARKVLDVRYTKKISPKERIEHIENLKSEAISYATDWMDSFIEGIIRYSDKSWVDIFGLYEDDPAPFFKAITIFSEKLDNYELQREE